MQVSPIHRMLQLARCLALCGTALVSHAAFAQAVEDDALSVGEIVITAQKRAQNLSDVPISVTAVTGDQLREQNVVATGSMGRIAPNLTVSDYGNPVITIFTLRGVSQFDFSDHQESPVAIFADGSYIPYLSAIGSNLFDLERVEVLRGPQGTLFGRNATGGVVQIISAKPTETLSGYGQLSYGNYDTIRAEGAISGPIGGGILARVSAVKDRHDGYFHNSLGGRKGDADNFSLRGQLYKRFDDGSDFGIIVRRSRDEISTSPFQARAAYPDPDTGLFELGNGADFADFCAGFFGAPVAPGAADCLSGDTDDGNPRTINNNREGGFTRTYWNANATLNLRLGDVTLTSISSYGRLRKSYQDEDSDGTSYDLLYYDQIARSDDYAQELRLAGSNGPADWLIGGYFLAINGDYSSAVGFYPGDPAFESNIGNAWKLNTRTWAVFGQTEVEIAPRLKLIAGARYTRDRKSFALTTPCTGPGCDLLGFTSPEIVQGTGYGPGVPGARTRRSSGNWDGKLQLSYAASDEVLIYGGVSRGTKAGGYNAGATAFFSIDETIFKDEVLTSYEAGVKYGGAGGWLQASGSFFYYDYKNVQVFSQLGPSTLTFNTDGEIYGAEADLRARLAPGLAIGVAGSLLHTRIDPIAVANVLTGDVSFQSQRLPNAPDESVSVYIDKIWDIGAHQLSAHADGKWVSSQKLNLIDYPATREPAYLTVNARIGFGAADESWEISLYAQNITKKDYRVAAIPFVTTNGAVIDVYGPPRTYGVSLRSAF